MKRLRYSMLIAATMAVAVVGAASASAATFTLTSVKCTGGAILNLCYENAAKEKLELEGASQPGFALGKPGNFVLPGVLTLHFVSSEAEVTLNQSSPLTTSGTATSPGFTFLTNSITAEPEIKEDCKLTAAEQTSVKTAALTGKLTSETNLEVKPTTGTEFISLTLENVTGKTCPALVSGTHSVTGFQNLTILEAGVAQEVKKADPEGKNLKFIGKAAELTEGEVELKFESKAGAEKLGDKVYVSKEA